MPRSRLQLSHGYPLTTINCFRLAAWTTAWQVNGKVRGNIQLAKDADEEQARELAFGDEKVAKFVDGKEVKKFIYVPGRIVNIVVGK